MFITNLDLSEPGSKGIEGVLHTPQNESFIIKYSLLSYRPFLYMVRVSDQLSTGWKCLHMTCLEFELAYYNVTVQHVSPNTM